MKIECVQVCVNYADFICWGLPLHRALFDNMVVVTTKADTRTQKLCEYWHVRCVVTDVCYENGAKFNKGKMINAGLDAIKGDGWVVHMDADIILPPLFRRIVDKLELDEDGLYHCDRLMCTSFPDWLRFYTRPVLQQENNVYVHPQPFEVGVRLAKDEWGGWCPLGFLSLWNQGKKKLRYPTENTDAGRSDLLFAQLFPRYHRHMLAEILAIHLETQLPDSKEMGANWNGRKTPEFGAEVLSLPGAPKKEDTKPAEPVTPTDPKPSFWQTHKKKIIVALVAALGSGGTALYPTADKPTPPAGPPAVVKPIAPRPPQPVVSSVTAPCKSELRWADRLPGPLN